MNGVQLYELLKKLFPINRSLTGEGVRQTLNILSQFAELNIHSINSGERVFDWVIPNEWALDSAVIKNDRNEILVDFKWNNLHILGYSCPFKGWVSKDELFEHLFYLDDQPNAIPYVTSYYKENWGFCVRKNDLLKFDSEKYYVEINSKLFSGKLNYADIVIPGESNKEIVFSTYICHPSMASNELSGPIIAIGLIDYLKKINDRKYTYRFVFVPETIGSIVYLSRNLKHLKENVIAGFVLTCLGDNSEYSLVQSRTGKTLADKIGLAVVQTNSPNKVYSFLDRGSDERQYCSPRVDLPFVTLTRTKFYEYNEYHTSLDGLEYTSSEALSNSLDYVKQVVLLLENNQKYISTNFCEPQLGPRGLYPPLSTKESTKQVMDLTNVLAYMDGSNDMVEIMLILKIDIYKILEIVNKLKSHNLIEICE
jgi:aminopeptidase-like protein